MSSCALAQARLCCGEETALIASIEGGEVAGAVRNSRPPYPSVKGTLGQAHLYQQCGDTRRCALDIGEGSTGLRHSRDGEIARNEVFAVNRKVKNPQLVEVPMGTTFGEIVYGICGGVQDDFRTQGGANRRTLRRNHSEKAPRYTITYEPCRPWVPSWIRGMLVMG